MNKEKLVLDKIKYYLLKEITKLKKQEAEYNEAAKTDKANRIKASCKQEVREELECLQAIIKSWEGFPSERNGNDED